MSIFGQCFTAVLLSYRSTNFIQFSEDCFTWLGKARFLSTAPLNSSVIVLWRTTLVQIPFHAGNQHKDVNVMYFSAQIHSNTPKFRPKPLDVDISLFCSRPGRIVRKFDQLQMTFFFQKFPQQPQLRHSHFNPLIMG
jgi:hypothetical protein